MPSFIDMLGREVSIKHPPKRIVSIVPSQTELLENLGLEDEVVGITLFCIHPKRWHDEKKRVGGTKKLKLDVIRELEPDLIIANKEENNKEDIEALETEFPVWVSDIRDLDSACEMIKQIGLITHKAAAANKLVMAINQSFEELPKVEKKPKVAYLIWNHPIMVAGGDTFIQEMISLAGFKNVFEGKDRYPEISAGQLESANPDVVFLSSEPFPFGEKHLENFQTLLPQAKVYLVDGELFSWYGSRLLHSASYFQSLYESVHSTL